MARNQTNGTWNDTDNRSRGFMQDDRIMRRGDDRTRESRDWGSSQTGERNSYRTDDYPTDKPWRAGGFDSRRGDRDMTEGRPFGNRNNQTHGERNYDQTTGGGSFSPDRGYGWSSDYRSSDDYHPGTYRTDSDYRSETWGDYRPSYDRSYSSSSGSTRDNGWSSDMSSNSWRTRGSEWDSDLGRDRWMGRDTQGFDRSYGRQDAMYGQGGDLSNARRVYGGATNFGTVTSDLYGPHAGKGPKNYRRSDDRIKEDVSDMLERNPQIDASEIEVDVRDGMVTLRGHVEDRRTKRMAEDAIENLQGVKDVRNELQVDQSLFQQAKTALLGETAESYSASTTNANRSTATKPKH